MGNPSRFGSASVSGPSSPVAAKDDDEAMLLPGLDEDFRVADIFNFGGEFGAKFLTNFRGNPSGAAIGDDAIFVERGKIRAGANIAGFQFDAQAEGFDDAAADLEFERVITETIRDGRGRCRE